MCSSFGGKGGAGRGFWYRTRTSRSAFELFWDDMAASACRGHRSTRSSSTRRLSLLPFPSFSDPTSACEGIYGHVLQQSLLISQSSSPARGSARLASPARSSRFRRVAQLQLVLRTPWKRNRCLQPKRGGFELPLLEALSNDRLDGLLERLLLLDSVKYPTSPPRSRRFEHALYSLNTQSEHTRLSSL